MTNTEVNKIGDLNKRLQAMQDKNYLPSLQDIRFYLENENYQIKKLFREKEEEWLMKLYDKDFNKFDNREMNKILPSANKDILLRIGNRKDFIPSARSVFYYSFSKDKEIKSIYTNHIEEWKAIYRKDLDVLKRKKEENTEVIENNKSITTNAISSIQNSWIRRM